MWEITCRNNYIATEKPVFRRHVTISEPNHSRQEITKNLGNISALKGQAIKNYPENLSFCDGHSLLISVKSQCCKNTCLQILLKTVTKFLPHPLSGSGIVNPSVCLFRPIFSGTVPLKNSSYDEQIFTLITYFFIIIFRNGLYSPPS